MPSPTPLLPCSLRLPLSLRLSPGRHLSPLSPPSPQSNWPTAPTPPPGARHAPPHRSSRARARPRGGDLVVGGRSLSTFGAGMASISRAGQGNYGGLSRAGAGSGDNGDRPRARRPRRRWSGGWREERVCPGSTSRAARLEPGSSYSSASRQRRRRAWRRSSCGRTPVWRTCACRSSRRCASGRGASRSCRSAASGWGGEGASGAAATLASNPPPWSSPPHTTEPPPARATAGHGCGRGAGAG